MAVLSLLVFLIVVAVVVVMVPVVVVMLPVVVVMLPVVVAVVLVMLPVVGLVPRDWQSIPFCLPSLNLQTDVTLH